MKYSLEIVIDKPIQEVIEKFDNVENMKEWMDGLQSFEHLSGTLGEVGAKAKLVFQIGNRNIEMIETITVKDLPKEFSGTYDAKGVHNIVKNYFSEIDSDSTLYKTDQEFQFKGFMKIIAALMPGAFKKQSKKYLVDFKTFVER
ncbi:MAG: SRPBCC family protein [Bacteroidota bacterium]